MIGWLASGPRRYAWNGPSRTWINTRDGHELYGLLGSEIKQLIDTDIDIEAGKEH
jgi:frataxin-like iron-binding protein CyaY